MGKITLAVGSRRLIEAMLQMVKLDIGRLQQAYNGEAI
jgi:hypothetical protein